jgi:hypothetical protein
MRFTKVEEQKGNYQLIYFTDSDNRIQGEFCCYKTEGKLPSAETLLYTKQYKDGEVLSQSWVKLPEEIFV